MTRPRGPLAQISHDWQSEEWHGDLEWTVSVGRPEAVYGPPKTGLHRGQVPWLPSGSPVVQRSDRQFRERCRKRVSRQIYGTHARLDRSLRHSLPSEDVLRHNLPSNGVLRHSLPSEDVLQHSCKLQSSIGACTAAVYHWRVYCGTVYRDRMCRCNYVWYPVSNCKRIIREVPSMYLLLKWFVFHMSL